MYVLRWLLSNCYVLPEERETDLELINIKLPVLLLQLLVRDFHRIESSHCIPQVLRSKRSTLHVERLLHELIELRLVHLLLLQRLQRPLLHRVLPAQFTIHQIPWVEGEAHLSWTRTQLAHLLLVPCELAVELLDLDLYARDPGVCLGYRMRRARLDGPSNAYRRDRFVQPRLGLARRGAHSKQSVHASYVVGERGR